MSKRSMKPPRWGWRIVLAVLAGLIVASWAWAATIRPITSLLVSSRHALAFAYTADHVAVFIGSPVTVQDPVVSGWLDRRSRFGEIWGHIYRGPLYGFFKMSAIWLTVPVALLVLPSVLAKLSTSRLNRMKSEGCCMKCGYSLRDNQSGRCPECGLPIPH